MVASSPVKPTISQAQPAGASRRSWFARVLVLIAWQVIAIMLAELLLFVVGLGEEEIFVFDKDIGTKHMVNKRVTWRSEGYAQFYLNADGMREPGLTVAKPPGTYRIALLGDSKVESFQVPLEETFGHIVADRLSKASGTKVEVLNFGIAGYSTVQECLQLKKQVLRYHPDMVISCYSCRDLFENTAQPDEIVRNVRPLAFKLPGKKLEIQNYYIQRWMRSPRGRFLQSLEWLRENSRIWGLVSVLDFDLALHNDIYREVARFFTQPKAEIREVRARYNSFVSSLPPFSLKDFCKGLRKKLIGGQPHARDSDETSRVTRQEPHAPPPVVAALVRDTMSALLVEMRAQCQKAGSTFVVAMLPARAALCPYPGIEPTFFHLGYDYEIKVISAICRRREIPMINLEEIAEQLPRNERPGLFYAMHFNPVGHRFVADAIYPFLAGFVPCRHAGGFSSRTSSVAASGAASATAAK